MPDPRARQAMNRRAAQAWTDLANSVLKEERMAIQIEDKEGVGSALTLDYSEDDPHALVLKLISINNEDEEMGIRLGDEDITILVAALESYSARMRRRP